MSEVAVFVEASGTVPGASLAQFGVDPVLDVARYVRIRTTGASPRSDVFEVIGPRRLGATGKDVYLQPRQLGLAPAQRSPAFAAPVGPWAWRLAQLETRNGGLVVLTLAFAVIGAWIDGSLAIGNFGAKLFLVETGTLGVLTGISALCKIAIAVCAFLLALWFKK